MIDIASSLEKEYGDITQRERESTLTELRRIEAAGRGRAEIKPHAIMLPLLFGFTGGIVAYGASTSSAMSGTSAMIAIAVGVVLVLASLWALLAPRAARFTLTEEGIRVKQQLLPWDTIVDYGVVEHSYNGFSTHTSVTLLHSEGFTPPKLGLLVLFGGSTRDRKSGLYETRLTLHAGARGMNCEKLAKRIGDFFAAAQARHELRRMQAD